MRLEGSERRQLRGVLQGREVSCDDQITSGHLTWDFLLNEQLEGYSNNTVRDDAGGSGGEEESRADSAEQRAASEYQEPNEYADDCNSKYNDLRLSLKRKVAGILRKKKHTRLIQS